MVQGHNQFYFNFYFSLIQQRYFKVMKKTLQQPLHFLYFHIIFFSFAHFYNSGNLNADEELSLTNARAVSRLYIYSPHYQVTAGVEGLEKDARAHTLPNKGFTPHWIANQTTNQPPPPIPP